ncbi:MAG: UDP-N-acetylmuramate:L-alanyl-gamma-D-glutamyl-meso-diaminopimelate ligase [Gammaproteobacteria bacterium]|nr:UDP-N-acetylmuramate:L-alanyl-gamma-D-glutamyl-meso-diaminopimelate ligase [Gammaproteobacteria bacterium]NNJ95594.1 UDP-N-acetylmuramate:L-alanyl-gamma-D-glutamyl-meso-diaminopimelate ligase [Gammaproteobacteria bacterium]
MHIHILGVCGTFMGGVALLARQAGHTVSGSDQNVYPPMSTQLELAGIKLCEGYCPEDITDQVDQVVIGNAMSRGNPMVEHVLNNNVPYTSGPQWLAENVLSNRWVVAVAGTHGKTSTSSMIAWILEYAGLSPGFLIGGVPANFGLSARYGEYPFFVVEADEYDTAFFDKRSKFVHYQPRTCVLNNLEFDHADIFDDVGAIKKQFHHLVRTVPGEGKLIVNGGDPNLDDVIEMGAWTPVEKFSVAGEHWSIGACTDDGSTFEVCVDGKPAAQVSWRMHGGHNRLNALAAIAAARHAGVPITQACEALGSFKGIKRRLEVLGDVGGVTVYDDFAHHPTAIVETLAAVKELSAGGRILAVLEPRSNTMRMGVHKKRLLDSLQQADEIYLYQPDDIGWNLKDLARHSSVSAGVYEDVGDIIHDVIKQARSGDHVVIMSNGGFKSIHTRLLQALEKQAA